jgi:hypothetical protein
MFKEAYLDYTTQMIIIDPHHLMARRLHAPFGAAYCPPDNPLSAISLESCCSLGSAGNAVLAFVPLQRTGGNHSLCYHNHWVQCSIAMYVEHCFAPVKQPVQMPGRRQISTAF